jgi:hypothetical protein
MGQGPRTYSIATINDAGNSCGSHARFLGNLAESWMSSFLRHLIAA